MSVLDDDVIRGLIRQAWHESQPSTDFAHEEGGFVLQSTDDSFVVERWPKGAKNRIVVPAHPGSTRSGMPIVATFHTHPNQGVEFQQEPSLTDIRAVRDDNELSGAIYEGEFVVSTDLVYLIRKDGKVEIVGPTKSVLGTE